ncbi:hypothetical protein [Streptosporangium roseum]|nr:hypothetical protein [Streptosporangium roseum]
MDSPDPATSATPATEHTAAERTGEILAVGYRKNAAPAPTPW